MNEIDVSKCAFYNNGRCNNPNGMACNCCNNACCYYKELQHLKSENEELKNCDKTNIYKQARVNFEKQKKYKQCLDEIEDFLEYEFYGENIWVKEQILQKIKEVKE